MQNTEVEQNNMGFIALIVAIATIGGFLFGYDSGVINGTVKGLQAAFNSDSVGTGFNVAALGQNLATLGDLDMVAMVLRQRKGTPGVSGDDRIGAGAYSAGFRDFDFG